MINEIHIENVTSYTKPSKISPTNKISLIYGLNGSGKSTISNFFYNLQDPQYPDCKITEDSESEVLVYNQKFLVDYFYEEDKLKGIFTLSKENKDVLVQIEQEINKFKQLEEDKTEIDEKVKRVAAELAAAKTKATEKVWEIKTKYTGEDRVLEYCLDDLKRKEKLFDHLKALNLPANKPTDTIDGLRKETDSIQGDKAHKIERLGKFKFSGTKIENDELFGKIIVGSKEGAVAEFINTLGNSDWVKTGLVYVPENTEKLSYPCPFCQEDTVTQVLLESIKAVFDHSYEKDILLLERLKNSYIDAGVEINLREIDSLAVVDSILSHKWTTASKEIKSIYSENKLLIESKIKNPSTQVSLKSSRNIASTINELINEVNTLIDRHNEKLNNKKATLASIKNRFWDLMRWDYDQTLTSYIETENRLNKEIKIFNAELKANSGNIQKINEGIVKLRKNTVNIEEAITNINNGLSEIGVAGFTVVKHSDNLYRIGRADVDKNVFHSLSEGEKTVISFLYFIELCKGQRSASSSPKKKVVVIDDPISSLSHIYVFNIGQLIKRIFFNSDVYEQIFVLTHSLYFFYELTHTNKDNRKKMQNLYRITKNSTGSSIIDMKYEEIQNDYQSYWSIIKDESVPPALIANCMRNIIEYFFNFVQKKDFNNVFQRPALSADKYQAFYRYMNRESHSLGQNIFDIKEFNYSDFKEGLKLIFDECGYPDHYQAMMK
ncbi:MAG: AAA family ATPase [Methylococcaceae bacterium]|nr:AAA family ATPase [Methylococcaceae bacterium]